MYDLKQKRDFVEEDDLFFMLDMLESQSRTIERLHERIKKLSQSVKYQQDRINEMDLAIRDILSGGL